MGESSVQGKILKQASVIFGWGRIPCPQSPIKQCTSAALNSPPAHYYAISRRPDLLLKMLQDPKLPILFASTKTAILSLQGIHLVLQCREENLL